MRTGSGRFSYYTVPSLCRLVLLEDIKDDILDRLSELEEKRRSLWARRQNVRKGSGSTVELFSPFGNVSGLSGGERTSRKTYYEIKPQELKAGLKQIPTSRSRQLFRHLYCRTGSTRRIHWCAPDCSIPGNHHKSNWSTVCDRPHWMSPTSPK